MGAWGHLPCDGDTQTPPCSAAFRQGKKFQSPASHGKLFQGLEMELKSTFACPRGENEPDFPLPALFMSCKLSHHSSVPQFPQERRCWGDSASRNQLSLQARAGEPSCPACSAKSQALLMLKIPKSPHNSALGCNFPLWVPSSSACSVILGISWAALAARLCSTAKRSSRASLWVLPKAGGVVGQVSSP